MAQSTQDARLCFIVDYDDVQAGITRKYQLLYFLADATIEMYDVKNRRVFLKRCPYPSLSIGDLYLGATVTIHSRQLRLTEYGDEYTKRVFCKKSEQTLGLIKPDGYERLGEILKCAAREGIRIKDIHMVQMTQEEAAAFFANKQSQPFYRELVNHVAAYPIVALHFVGEDCSSRWRSILGPEDPVQAKQSAPTSIRAKYGTSRVCNVAHASEDSRSEEEINFFFGQSSNLRLRNNAALSNCTLCLIKPHAIAAGHGGDVVTAILDEGYEISAIMVTHLRPEDGEDFLEVYKGVLPEYRQLLDQLVSGPCWALEVRAENAVQAFRQTCGPHDPEIARVLRPDSLRARFGVDKVKNAVHCTDLAEDGVLESEFFFRLIAAKQLTQ
eukprot:TRINITY_DN4088_c0_g1_i1.p1 TRINITY_DN4088_c0_g1~~TRINITY_DN4088_c0_g1_i1.p1  ORF type:complete len:384 (-),score=64.18 TRINITY_DN4088_c0_g1_i1:74-1225(-)